MVPSTFNREVYAMNIQITIRIPSGAGGVTLSNGETSVDASALLAPPAPETFGTATRASALPGPPDLNTLSTSAGENGSASLPPPPLGKLLAATDDEAGSEPPGPPSVEALSQEAEQEEDGEKAA